MITVEEALERILSNVHILEPEEKPILDCQGQVLAEDIRSTLDVPPADNSAMDGYAVLAESIRSASPDGPVTLQVIGEVAAGYTTQAAVAAGAAIRIMTGAPVPPGADTVVPFEETDEVERRQSGRSLDEIAVRKAVPAAANIRRAGEDIMRGELVLSQGTLLRPAEIGVLASLGRATVKVIRRPRVAVLATGDELVPLGQPLGPGQIYNSNSYSLASQVLRYGGIPLLLGIARDRIEDLRRHLDRALEADIVLTSAGVSQGYYDVVKEVLAEEGEITFWTVRMRPGKPLAFGVLGKGGRRIPHLGLPGNPVSSMVCFELYARPAIYKMLGRTNWEKPAIWATLQDTIRNPDGRRTYARAIVTRSDGQYYARTTGNQGSGVLTSMARANGLAVVPEDSPGARPGDRVRVLMLDWHEDTDQE
ncbi:MAG: molybdopterin molybdotransferase MoeA [Chloroflexi bacterium]|nr:molybdopterin molybdotransferase MoeA [Chloroflexota bacterium]